ncbi:misato Segment II myosin-like domain-containing protein [Phlyctema vagabunda]|uniref:Misato Segment II myosin-like domain-containing protein n=1 Tax=Phlyctema vagabunda TaxID=108571 RepID=A0ABR4PYL8_9HELO
MHEILTVQLGQRSNYLATHFWNTQESYFTYSSDQESLVDHDIHFRPGIGADGSETFTPRTLIYDLKGGFGSLRKLNALYELEEPDQQQALWNGPTVVQRQEVIPRSAYQQSLDDGLLPPELTTESVRYWSDFSRVYYHPRSIVQLNEYELNSSLMPFENWDTGESLFNSLDKEHDLLDRDLRPFAEEADQMQGIQLFSGTDDAWGGFAARYIDRIRDEYGKTTVWFWGLEDGHEATPREKRLLKLSNTARSISEIASQASLYVPLTIPSASLPDYIHLNRRSPWHKSALISTAVETMTLASRLRPRNGIHQSLDQTGNALNINGNQNLAKLRMSVERGRESGSNGVNGDGTRSTKEDSASRDSRIRALPEANPSDADEEIKTFDIDFFPGEIPYQGHGRRNTKKCHVFGQAENLRGDDESDAEEEHRIDEGQERARRRAAGLPLVHKTRINMSFPLLDSFPRIFSPDIQESEVRVNTSLSTDTTVALRIKNLQSIVGRAVGIEEREALSNSLGEIAEAYEEGWDSGSDDDDD